ncbi:hypothetical protein F5H01DRAFT_372149 [Linnemannia elongata]|nr:hypothetical protein F5H01DRAFT_372149 [Linnemannia elongata]
MAMEVLSICPRLQVFSYPHIPTQVYHPASSGTAKQQPLTCRQHHRPLDVFIFKADGNLADWTVKGKEQLSSFNDWNIIPSAKCGKLSSFEFGDSSPRTVMEAQWMVQTWKKLKTVKGVGAIDVH